MNAPSRRRIRLARLIAMGADLVQIGFFPLFAEGFISPFNLMLDLVVSFLLTKLIGWHFAFLPTFIMESLPIMDVVPSWTIAVLIATRQTPSTQPNETVLDVPVTVIETSSPAPRSQRR